MLNTLPILIFHTLEKPGPAISFSARDFRRNLGMLHQRGYRTLSLLTAVERLRQGQPFPPRALVLTFDDGYRSVYEKAFPVLQRYAMSATIFVTTGLQRPSRPTERLPSCVHRPMLSWNEIREMHSWGVEIGAHSCTHADLTRLPTDRIQAELGDSKAIIEDMLGSAVQSFAYPYGRYDERCLAIARQHFDCACSDRLGLVTQRSRPYALERIDAYYLRPDGLFRLLATRWFPSYVRLRRITRGAKRALQVRRR